MGVLVARLVGVVAVVVMLAWWQRRVDVYGCPRLGVIAELVASSATMDAAVAGGVTTSSSCRATR